MTDYVGIVERRDTRLAKLEADKAELVAALKQSAIETEEAIVALIAKHEETKP